MTSAITRKALLVGIDGFNLARVDHPNVQAPTLTRLRDEAVFAPSRIYPDDTSTVSGPGWSTILTGVWPTKHRVLGNDIGTDTGGHGLATYPDLFGRTDGHQTFFVATWPPLYDQILLSPVTHRTAFHGNNWLDKDRVVCVETVAALQGDFDLGFAYFGAPDEMAHAHGATSQEYDCSIEAVDGYLATLLRTIRNRPTYDQEDWLVAVTTDHGHRPEGGHGGQSDAERSTFVMLTEGGADAVDPQLASSMRIVDIAPTLLDHLGVPVDEAWNLDGRSVRKAA